MTPTHYTHTRRRQSVKVHIVLFLLTAGIGNIIYAKWANSNTAARYEW